MNETLLTRFHEGELYDAYKLFGCIFDEEKNEAVFRVYAPHARGVSVVGDFNDWDEER